MFTTVDHGCLPIGTVTPLGTIIDVTMTAYRMDDRSFVPFAKGPRSLPFGHPAGQPGLACTLPSAPGPPRPGVLRVWG